MKERAGLEAECSQTPPTPLAPPRRSRAPRGRGVGLLASAQPGQREGNSLALWLRLWQPDFSELLVAGTTSACPRVLSGEDSSPTQLTQSPVQATGEGKEFRCPSSAFLIESPLVPERFQIYAAILEIITHPQPINFISACAFAAWCSKAIFATNWATEFTFTW